MRSELKIVVAPDKFKGSLTALEAAEAMMHAARDVYPAAEFLIRPMADGGEGTLDALMTARGGRMHDVAVTHPLGAIVNSSYGLLSDGSACVEMARASGLQLVGSSEREALAASSLGTGELIAHALSHEPPSLVVGIGGSASTDGGTGAARAIGWRFLDASGADLPPGGGALVDLARIVPPEHEVASVPIIGACDVDAPLTGPVGAARRFGPQKGATPGDVERLEAGLANLAERIRVDVGVDVASLSGAGAGGGMGAGLVAFFRGDLRGGFDVVASATDLAADISDAGLVLTGEGRLDGQSLAGKVPIGVGRLARRAKVPCIAIAGDLQVERRELRANGIEIAVGILQTGGRELSERDPAGAVERAVLGTLKHHQDRRAGRRMRRGRRRWFGLWSARPPERFERRY
ncbi:MAG: glycerate kinase [Actinomycetota bacterium]|nr:glycerate kinase [Actinomycetota bacterium]